jgi:hypothetical protein
MEKADPIKMKFWFLERAMGIEPNAAFLEATEDTSVPLSVLEHFGTQSRPLYRPLRVVRRREHARRYPE